MTVQMKTLAVGAAVCLAIAAAACSPTKGTPTPAVSTPSVPLLNGLTFAAVATTEEGHHRESNLSFEDGIFYSSACNEFGFDAAPYTLKRDGDALAFRAVLRDQDGSEVWAGRIIGSDVEGTVTGADGVATPFRARAVSTRTLVSNAR